MPELIFRDRRNREHATTLSLIPGHFYSPFPNAKQLARPRRRRQLWPPEPLPMPGVEWRAEAQLDLCRDVLGAQQPLEFPVESSGDVPQYTRVARRYPLVDAYVLQALLRHYEPSRVVEIGAGYSSLVTARVNRELFGGRIHFTAIDPEPLDFLKPGVPGITELRAEEVQDTPMELFEQLGANDIVLVDTGHAVKTGGEVPWVHNQVLPRLRRGVVVQVHDIFLPYEYPESWVLQGRAWAEQYLVQSFLVFNSAWEVTLGTHWLIRNHWDVLRRAFPDLADDDREGHALWIRRL